MDRAMLWPEDGSFRYRSDAPFIFRHISFSIKGGEVLALLGRKGAVVLLAGEPGVGKSTLLSCPMGFSPLVSQGIEKYSQI